MTGRGIKPTAGPSADKIIEIMHQRERSMRVSKEKALKDRQKSAPAEAFRLMDLPPELRSHIYSFLLPQDMVITWRQVDIGLRYRTGNGKPFYLALAVRKGEDIALRIGGPSYHDDKVTVVDRYMAFDWMPTYLLEWPKHPAVETQLFLVSKAVCNEAQGKSPPRARDLLCLLVQRSCMDPMPSSFPSTETLSGQDATEALSFLDPSVILIDSHYCAICVRYISR
jgi:hypothetical protein